MTVRVGTIFFTKTWTLDTKSPYGISGYVNMCAHNYVCVGYKFMYVSVSVVIRTSAYLAVSDQVLYSRLSLICLLSSSILPPISYSFSPSLFFICCTRVCRILKELYQS